MFTFGKLQKLYGRFRVLQLLQLLITRFAPAIPALLAVLLEARLKRWAAEREAILPLILFLLISSLVYPRVRALMMVSLCYGVAFLALRDAIASSHQSLPPAIAYDFVEVLRPILYVIVAGLAIASAYIQTVNSGQVWARRCYFGAAAVYFLSTGVITYAGARGQQGIFLMICGGMALFGSLYSDVSTDGEDSAPLKPKYLEEQIARDRAHSQRIESLFSSSKGEITKASGGDTC